MPCGVPRLSSLFEIPAQLAMLLSLAASTAGHDAPVEASKAFPTAAPELVEPIEGPLRFTERGWMRALYENQAEAEGLGARIFVTSGGRYYVPVASDRRRILETRQNAEIASRVTSAAAVRDAARIRSALQRAPAAADLYVAHVFGRETAISLIKEVGRAPDAPLKESFPMLAALPEVQQGNGAPPTVAQFYRRLSAGLGEPPRLVAIGLRPLVADPEPDQRNAESPARDSIVAWQAKVDIAGAGGRTQ
jgi:hypothetical protein